MNKINACFIGIAALFVVANANAENLGQKIEPKLAGDYIESQSGVVTYLVPKIKLGGGALRSLYSSYTTAEYACSLIGKALVSYHIYEIENEATLGVEENGAMGLKGTWYFLGRGNVGTQTLVSSAIYQLSCK